jgi:hypothetical protein
MAKKATANTIPKWIPLSEAKQLVVDTYESKELAERLLVEWLREAKVRWRSKRFEPPTASALAAAAAGIDYGSAPVIACSEGDAAFWHTRLKINWEENSAIGGACAYGIEVAREDVLAQLPEEVGERKKAAPAPPPPGKAEPKKRTSRQQERVMRAVWGRWPNGEWNDLPTATVWGIVGDELAAESKAQGLAIPSQSTVARALGRRSK